MEARLVRMARLYRRRGATRRTSGGGWRVESGRLRRWLGAALAVLAIAFGAYAGAQRLLDPDRFPVRRVELEGGLRNLTAAELRDLAAVHLAGHGFFTLDVAALRAVLAAEPWLEWVDVRRQWPDAVIVRFRERVAFGRWGEDEMVDVNGVRFRPARVRQPGPWPQLAGPNGQEKTVLRAYREAGGLLAGVGLKVTRLVLDERRAWSLGCADGVELSLGREQFAQRLRRFVEVYPDVLAPRIDEIAAVDLRYVNGFAVRWN